EIFLAALERTRDERVAFVDEACGGDAELRAEVAALLLTDAETASFLNSPVAARPASEEAAALVPPGTRIGRYLVLRCLGGGGLGAAYEAEQDRPRRVVALKLMRRGLSSRSALRRFEDEAQILARLHHPGIAQVFEAGVHDDGSGPLPWFAMELIPDAARLTEH